MLTDTTGPITSRWVRLRQPRAPPGPDKAQARGLCNYLIRRYISSRPCLRYIITSNIGPDHDPLLRAGASASHQSRFTSSNLVAGCAEHCTIDIGQENLNVRSRPKPDPHHIILVTANRAFKAALCLGRQQGIRMGNLHRIAAKQITQGGLSVTARIILASFSALFGAVMFLTAPPTDKAIFLRFRCSLRADLHRVSNFRARAPVLRQHHRQRAVPTLGVVPLLTSTIWSLPFKRPWCPFIAKLDTFSCRIRNPGNQIRGKGPLRPS